jgi:flagellar hook-length control protein FliK
MNNASLLLNAARPQATTHAASPAPSAASSSSATDTSAPQKSFDHALGAARADTHTHKADDTHHDTSAKKSSSDSSSDTSAKSSSDTKKSDTKASKDDDADKNDDSKKDSDDTSLATSMLALIGVPVPATQALAKGLGLVKDAVTGKGADALATLTGAKGDAADAAAAAKPDGLNALTANAAATATGTTDTAKLGTSPFATLLATQGAVAGATKDDTKGVDPATIGPMPLAHTQAPDQLSGPVQLQATQAATSPQFSQELGEQIAWMSSAAGDVKEARIKLHPEELGSMDVRVNVDGGKVNVAIMAQHPAAVHAVQQTLSNLDTLLAHHGLSLGQAEVNQGNAQQQGGSQGQGQGGSSTGDADGAGDTLVTAATSRVSRGLVDEVA